MFFQNLESKSKVWITLPSCRLCHFIQLSIFLIAIDCNYVAPCKSFANYSSTTQLSWEAVVCAQLSVQIGIYSFMTCNYHFVVDQQFAQHFIECIGLSFILKLKIFEFKSQFGLFLRHSISILCRLETLSVLLYMNNFSLLLHHLNWHWIAHDHNFHQREREQRAWKISQSFFMP